MSEGVVLLHGIFRTSWSMRGLEKFLRKNGYDVLNVNYRSTKHSLEEIADLIHDKINSFNKAHDKLHFVGYSMGGLVTRTYIAKYRPANLGRVVMLGTPNQGSEVADLVAGWAFYKWSYGPAGQQLITDQSAFRHLFGTVDYEVGILAGDRSLDPLGSWALGKPGDGKVSIDSTKLEGMTDHAIVATDHTFFPQRKVAWEHTLRFLKNGRF